MTDKASILEQASGNTESVGSLVPANTDPQEILDGLKARGFSFRLDGTVLVVIPGSLLTPDDRTAIRHHKDALVALLATREGPGLFTRVFAAGLSLDGLLRLERDLEAGDPACRYYTAWSEPGAGRLLPLAGSPLAAGLLREVLAEIVRRRAT